MDRRIREIAGKKYGRLTAREWTKKNGRSAWICDCECGSVVTVAATNLYRGKSTSCGCKRKESLSALFDDPDFVRKNREALNKANGWTGITTGENKKLYYVLRAAIRRCTVPADKKYANYGGRGIRVCQDWVDDPQKFVDYVLEVLGERPTSKHSIDRINANGNYEPGNIRWASYSEQNANTRGRKSSSGYKGVSFCKQTGRWRVQCGGKNGGRHKDPVEAAKIYDKMARELYGEFARCNFPE